jgi:hypothetical protein
MLALFGLREVERTGLEDAAGLAGLDLKLLVQRHGVVLQAADVGGVVQAVNVGRRMPGRTGGEFVTLEQHHVGPAELGEMIKNGTTDETAADDDGLSVGAHGFAALKLIANMLPARTRQLGSS